MDAMDNSEKSYIHQLFEIGILFKFFHALFEICVAAALFFIKPTTIYDLLASITVRERIEDPQDVLINFLLNETHRLSSATIHFAALYLFVSAIVNLILVYGLHRQKLRAYPLSIAILFMFAIYQMQSFIHSHSLWMLVITAYDLALMYLIYREYTRLTKIPSHMS